MDEWTTDDHLIRQIYHLFGKKTIQYIGCKDEYENMKLNNHRYYIMNLSNKADAQGTHWTCFLVRNTALIYFDSFGCIYPNVIERIARKHKLTHIFYNTQQIQDPDTGYCGQYCLHFLNWFHTHKTGDINTLYEGFRALYSDVKNNHKRLIKYVKKINYNKKPDYKIKNISIQYK